MSHTWNQYNLVCQPTSERRKKKLCMGALWGCVPTGTSIHARGQLSLVVALVVFGQVLGCAPPIVSFTRLVTGFIYKQD